MTPTQSNSNNTAPTQQRVSPNVLAIISLIKKRGKIIPNKNTAIDFFPGENNLSISKGITTIKMINIDSINQKCATGTICKRCHCLVVPFAPGVMAWSTANKVPTTRIGTINRLNLSFIKTLTFSRKGRYG